MKKYLFFLFFISAISVAAYANPVGIRTAGEVGMKFLNANAKTMATDSEELQLETVYYTTRSDAAFYVFNSLNGFVIVAADDCVKPILGYSYEGRFDKDNIPVQLQVLFQMYIDQIEYGIEKHVKPNEDVMFQWELVQRIGVLGQEENKEVVLPLLTTQWDQGWPYNAQCPSGCPTGCVATATAQIMNYWQYPEKGVGYNSYYDYYSAVFNNTYYQWDIMDTNHPDEISTLLYHVGISMFMQYDPAGSSAYLFDACEGIKRFFDYSESCHELYRYENEENWVQLLRMQLLDDKPVLYAGGSHAWVVDGFDTDGFFHMNFGWNGNQDGYFSIDNLVVGWYDFNSFQSAVLDIVPAYSPLTADFVFFQEGEDAYTFQFYDFSKNTPNSFLWNFGDGSTSTQQNPTHHFPAVGLYTVTLTASKGGQVSSISMDVNVSDFSYFSHPQMLPLRGAGTVLDYDMDGSQDILWFGYEGTSLLKNNGWSTVLGCNLEQVENYTECTMSKNGIFRVNEVDFLNVNKPSVLYECIGESKWHYFRNEEGMLVEDHSFLPCFITDEESGIVGAYTNDLWHNGFDILDYNNDGLTDVVCGTIAYRNLGNGLFQPVYDLFPDGFNSFYWGCIPTKSLHIVSAIDIDKDGDLDVFSNNGLYINQGNGSYQWRDLPSGWVSDDLNNDGWPDIVDHAIHISSGSDLVFDTRDTIFIGMAGTSAYQQVGNATRRYLAHADVNNDGYLDLIGSYLYDNDTVYSYVNGTVESTKCDFSWNEWMLAWIDIDGDGSIDAIKPERAQCGGASRLLKNIHSGNAAPSAPTNLYAETSGNTVFLHWNPSTDDHTYTGSITYNIAVGTAPGLCDVYSPLSNLTTGKRFVVDKGNAGMGTVWRINDLPDGTYYWQVQAIDQAFASSPFSSMSSFTINGGNIRPAMAPFVMNCRMNEPNMFSVDDVLSHYVDRDHDMLQSVLITSLPSQGALFLDGVPISLNQSVNVDDIGNMYYYAESCGVDEMRMIPYDGSDYAEFETSIRFRTILLSPMFESHDFSGNVAMGDYDNDGQMDFASVAGIFHNTGSTFEQLTVSTPSAEKVLWADVNNDGKLDALYDGYVLTNLGNGQFSQDATLVNWFDIGSAVGDLNSDNKVDYIICGMDTEGNRTRLYYNYNNAFSNGHALNTLEGFDSGDVAVGDFNNDGLQDFVINGCNSAFNYQTMLYQNTDGIYSSIPHEIPGLIGGSLSWGDYDGDGDLDLLLCGSTAVFIYDNIDGSVFVQRDGLPLAALSHGEAVWYDYDNDGYLDILLSGADAGTRLYHNVNGNDFVEIDLHGLPDLSYSSIDVADCNGDGFEDVAISGLDEEGNPYTGVFYNGMVNGGKKSNGHRMVPTNLSSNVVGSSVVLSWDCPDEASYNVYVYDADGFVVSPMADLNTGFKKTVDIGNVGYSTSYTLRNLDSGTYQWSVQAVDRSRQGSTFVDEQTFTIVCDHSETIVVYDTACYAYVSAIATYYQSGTYNEYYVGTFGCDSIVERHLTIVHDCTPIIYVSTDGNMQNSGFSWDSSLPDLQTAMDLAASIGGIVWVAQGSYYGDGVSDNAFSIPAGIRVYGGFKGDELPDYDLSLRDFRLHPSILDGQHVQRTVGYENWYMGESTIDGFTIQNGNHEYGANISSIYYCYPLCVTNCIVRNGTAGNEGGAASGASLRNSLIVGNVSGGDCLNGCTLINCTVVDNVATLSVLASNLINCIVWHCGATVMESNQFSWVAIEGLNTYQSCDLCLSSENDGTSPVEHYVRFVNPEDGDYRLLQGSACINAGTPDISPFGLPSVDLDGAPRVMEGCIDIGAYEFDPDGGDTGIAQSRSLASLHPNPVVDRLTVEADDVIRQCEIYSVTGVLLVTKYCDSKRIGIDVADLPTGFYVIRLTFNNAVEVLKFLKE